MHVRVMIGDDRCTTELGRGRAKALWHFSRNVEQSFNTTKKIKTKIKKLNSSEIRYLFLIARVTFR